MNETNHTQRAARKMAVDHFIADDSTSRETADDALRVAYEEDFGTFFVGVYVIDDYACYTVHIASGPARVGSTHMTVTELP